MHTFVSNLVYHSPLGDILISANEKYITQVRFADQHEIIPDQHPSSLTLACARELKAYFEGTCTQFQTPVKQEGSDFQQAVWAELHKIQFGKTENYLGLSKKLGNSKAIRAVGSANGKNNIAIIIPCHRVIGSDGSLVGYAGGMWRKKWLLEHEAKHAGGVLTLF
jgi:methylated-DNA-[protein]-cysteine S-methyltransferase